MSDTLFSLSSPIHIGNEIRKRVVASGMSIKEFARLLCCERHSVYYIFKQDNIDINRLLKISEILGFDFLSLYSGGDGNGDVDNAEGYLGILPLADCELDDFKKKYPQGAVIKIRR